MSESRFLLRVQYDGSAFAGWQVQPERRTVQGVMEVALTRLCGAPISVIGAGRTDAGVHARGQCAGAAVPEKWSSGELRRAMNAVLPSDVWIESVHRMRAEFHPRYSATSRRYRYFVGTDEGSRSPFRSRYEWTLTRPLDGGLLSEAASQVAGDHSFRGFAVKGTAREGDDHRCLVTESVWNSESAGRWAYSITANRFLHHMVRFLVGTMVDIAAGRRSPASLGALLGADSNSEVSAPAPARGLFLEDVRYPAVLFTPEGPPG